MSTSRRVSRPGPEPVPGGSADVDAEPDPHSVARAIALRQLTAAPRSRAELAQAMARKAVPADVAEEVLDRLEEVSLVDDAAYASMLVRSKQASRGLARRALAHELRAKGVDAETAAAALDGVDPDDELATARQLVARRLRSTAGLDTQVRVRRLSGMLARKGYPPGVALRVVKEALADEADPGEFDGLTDADE